MFELTRGEYSLAAPLFAPIPHHRVIVFSVLEGSCPGRVFVDDRANPRSAFVSSITEFCFFGGDAGNADFNAAVRSQVIPGLLAQMQGAAFSGPDQDWQAAVDALLAGYPGGWAQRAEFDFPAESYPLVGAWRRSLPQELRVETYNREVAARFEELELFWNGIHNFLSRGFGFYVARGDQLLSRCHTVAVGAGLAEISVETQPAFRGQGLALLAAGAFIEHSLRVGLQPHWTCWDNNLPSLALASKLGFAHTLDAPVRYVQNDG